MRFLRRWMEDSLGLALALLCAVLAMQAPALTHDYAAALLQVAREARRDIDQRMTSARQYYAITADDDAALVAALRGVEPSNADTLTAAIERTRQLQLTHDRIESAPPLLRPLVAAWDAMTDDRGDRAAIRGTLLETYTPEIVLSTAAAAYGLFGLLVGMLAAQALLWTCGGLARLVIRRDGERYAR